tara:strand:- start:1063 stop:1335 length:273 start_codon:yes stop_codon:yes gene_type:complete
LKKKKISLSKRRTVDRKDHQNTNFYASRRGFFDIIRSVERVWSRFLSPSLSLSFLKGKKKKKRKRADDDDADDVSRNDFVVVLLHGCNEN